jgi:6-phosphogluconolactonase
VLWGPWLAMSRLLSSKIPPKGSMTQSRFLRAQNSEADPPTMNTCLVRPEEAAPCLTQGKPAQEHAPLAGHEKSRTPAAAPVQEQNRTWLQRIRNRSLVMRASSALWAALAIAVSLFAAPLRAQFVYVANDAIPGNVSGYKIDPSTGVLTEITGSPFTAGSNPFSVAVDPSGKFAYVANSGSDSVSGYTINPSTGVLTEITGSPFSVPTGSQPVSVAVDPSGKFVYVANHASGSDSVSGFTIAPGTGALTAIAGSPFSVPTGSQPSSVAVDPSGKFVYVANLVGNVSGFTIGTGALTAIGSFAANTSSTSVAVDPSGKFVYVANQGRGSNRNFPGNVSGYTINSTTGALTPIPTVSNPQGVFFDPGTSGRNQTLSRPRSVAVDPSGKFVYVANFGSDNVSGFTVAPGTGALTAMAASLGDPFPAGLFPTSVAVDPSGKFAYVANSGGGAPGTVSEYKIDSTTGALTAIDTINAGTSPESVAVALVPCPAPVITGATASPHVLWPPNHKFVDVTIDYTETSNCSSTCTLSVTSNEPGPNEWIIVDEHHVQLLAERNGNGSGRVYTITIACTNAGGTTNQDVTVLVPHDQGQ